MLESHMIQYGVLNIRFINFTNKFLPRRYYQIIEIQEYTHKNKNIKQVKCIDHYTTNDTVGLTNGTNGPTNDTIGTNVSTNGDIGTTNDNIGTFNGNIGTNGTTGCKKRSGFSGYQWFHWLPIVTKVKFPMVPLGEPRMHAM